MELHFPREFLWGTSSASYQIEGAVAADGRVPSIWDTFCRIPGAIRDGATGDAACDHYHRWREDVGLMAAGGHNAYRFSIAWPRLFAGPDATLNRAGIAFYDGLVDELLRRRIEPLVCFYHWDLPQWVQDLGGWANRDTAYRFVDYGLAVARRLGDRVRWFLPFNEPNVHVWRGMVTGTQAPGLRERELALAAIHHIALAHGLVVPALRAELRHCRIGSAVNLGPVRPVDDSAAARRAARDLDAFWNRVFLEPAFAGRYPAPFDTLLQPYIRPDDPATLRAPWDFIGVNYYQPLRAQPDPRCVLGMSPAPPTPDLPVTDGGWVIEPDALREILLDLTRRYPDADLLITENGAVCYDRPDAAGQVVDVARIRYLDAHLRALHRAIADGARVRGYLAWTLTDNFEWAYGFTWRFGLVWVDFVTQRRLPKRSYHWFAEVARRNGFAD